MRSQLLFSIKSLHINELAYYYYCYQYLKINRNPTILIREHTKCGYFLTILVDYQLPNDFVMRSASF